MARPKKSLPKPPESAPKAKELISLGIERRGGLYVAFLIKTVGDKVIHKQEKDADLKVSACDYLYQMFCQNFVEGDID